VVAGAVAATVRGTLEVATPGLGFDVLDVVQAGIDLVKDPLAFGADLFKDLLGEGLLALGSLAGGWFGGFLDALDRWGALISAGWDLLKEIPVLGDWLASAESMFDNFLDTLWFELTGTRTDIDDPGRGDVHCVGDLPRVGGSIDWYTWYRLTPHGGEDIAASVQAIISAVFPRVYRFADDAPRVSPSTFMLNSTWRASDSTWDVDDDFARDPGRHPAAAPYVRAYKVSHRRLLVEVGGPYACSFWPCSRSDGELAFEHEGDGEAFFLNIQIDPANGDMEGDTLGRATLTGIVTKGHSATHWYGWDTLRLDGGRAVVTIARSPTGTRSSPRSRCWNSIGASGAGAVTG
jgi:hypothetical protein